MKFEPEKINALLGTHIPAEEMLAYFDRIELAYDKETNEIVAPTFRHDIFRTADLAEEVARFYGYDNIPTTLPSGEATTGKKSKKMRVEDLAKEIAEFCGFSRACAIRSKAPRCLTDCCSPQIQTCGMPFRLPIHWRRLQHYENPALKRNALLPGV